MAQNLYEQRQLDKQVARAVRAERLLDAIAAVVDEDAPAKAKVRGVRQLLEGRHHE